MADELQDVPYTAGWVSNLAHKPDPNRVKTLQMPVAGRLVAKPEAAAAFPATSSAEHRRPALGAAAASDPQSRPAEPSYYDIPMLKAPVWKWEIASYFFLGGLSAGAYLLSRVADRFGGGRYRRLSRIGAWVALGTLLPSPPLLIHDLGDRKRFHHMLRIWKPTSPMNLGTWALMAYSGMASFECVRQYLARREDRSARRNQGPILRLMNHPAVVFLHDLAGIPFSLLVAGYTGVLLSCTSNPLWCKNPWLGPLFSASAISTGTEAISLALDLTGAEPGPDAAAQRALLNIDTLAHAAELASLCGFNRHAGEKGASLRTGPLERYHLLSVGCILGAEVLKRLPVGRRLRRPVRMVASAFGLTAGFSLRWSMIFGGHAAANDPRTARLVSKPKTSPRDNNATAALRHGAGKLE